MSDAPTLELRGEIARRAQTHGCLTENDAGQVLACHECIDSIRPLTTWTAFGGHGWECPQCGGLVAVSKERGPVPCPFGCLLPSPRPLQEPSEEAACAPEESPRPIEDGERVWIAGEPVWIQYVPDLTDDDGQPVWGSTTTAPTGYAQIEVKPYGALPEVVHTTAGVRRVIRLRRWDERVYLHEVLHILVGRHYPHGTHAYDGTFIADPKHEAAVREIEDALWDMGWRLFDGESYIDPSQPRRPPSIAAEPGPRPGHYPGCTREAGHPGPCEPNALSSTSAGITEENPHA